MPSSHHHWQRSNGGQSGVIWLKPARKAWLRHNELRLKSEPILLIDLQQWREQRQQSLSLWLESETALGLAHHQLTHIRAPEISVDLTWIQSGIEQVGENLTPSREQVARAAHALGQVSLSFAVALLLLFAGPVVVIQTQDIVSQAMKPKQEVAPQNQEPIATTSPETTSHIREEKDVFSLSIPELNITSNVTANVDPGDEKSYGSALKKGIAHAAGTGLPGQLEQNKTIYLFAHSTDAPWNIARYNAQFYGLKDAQEGQEITLRFWGKDTKYKITRTEIVPASDTTYLQPQTEKEQLILQTCYPPGTAWKRLIVVAEPIS